MFGCISNYIISYYNYYFPSEKSTTHNYTHISTNTSSEIDLTKSTTQNLSTLEIQDSYELVFSTSNNSPKNLELLFYEIYSSKNLPTYIDSKLSTIFRYNNKLFKIVSKKNYKTYISIITDILNFKLKNIVTPDEIYYNKYKKNEYIEIYPYYPDGDLFSYIENSILDNFEKKNIFTKIVDVISELHKINIAHRDIKPENFLIQIKNNDIFIKITDLDFACINDTDFNFTGGTLQYASYELLNFKKFNNWFSSDIWSITIILYILLFNTFPWSNTLTYEIYDNNKNKIYQPCDIFNNYITNKDPYKYWSILLSKIFHKNDRSLPIYNQLLNYGFNKNYNERNDISYIKYLLSLI